MTVKVGDVILVTKTFLDCGMYRIGDILEVGEVLKGCVRVKNVQIAIGNDEFEVIERGELNGLLQHFCKGAVASVG